MKWLTASAKAPEGVKTEVELRRNGSAGEAICTFLGDVKPSQVCSHGERGVCVCHAGACCCYPYYWALSGQQRRKHFPLSGD